jgi:PAS domain S-box-containing protein
MFSLAAVVLLGVGVVIGAASALESQADTERLHNLGEAADAVRAAIRNQSDLQPVVDRLRSSRGLSHCAVVSNEGRYVAHTSSDLAGRRREMPTGEVVSWGGVQRTRYEVPDCQVLREYQTPLTLDGETWGTLLIAAPEPGKWATVTAAARYLPAPLFCLVVLLLAIGTIALRRTVRPMAQIEKQLRDAALVPAVSGSALEPIDVSGPAAVGWDRLVARLRDGERREDLDSRLTHALEKYRGQKSEQILHTLPDGVAVTGEDGRISFANKALVGLLGKGTSGRDLCGTTMEKCLPVESAGATASQLFDPRLNKRVLVVELCRSGVTSEGTLRVARLPLRTPGSEGEGGHVWCIRDVTQQKMADQMRDQFVNAATHELRTPLANIKAYAETLALGEVTEVEEQKAFCNTIDEEVTRLARFVDDLLYLCHMEVGSTSLKRQVTDMERLFHELVNKVRPQMKQKDISFKVSLPGKLPELVVDKEKLTVALVNLLGNAAKYTPEGGQVRLNVETKEKEDVLQIDVEDTGIGIPAEEQGEIFTKFFRSADPRVHEQPGSGLGLSLTAEIVRLHGGSLKVRSELDKGSTFTANLPLSCGDTKCSSAQPRVPST